MDISTSQNKKALSVINKLHLSMLILTSVVGIGFILFGVPVYYYDRYVIKRDKACFYSQLKENRIVRQAKDGTVYEKVGDDEWVSIEKHKFDPNQTYEVPKEKSKFDPDAYLNQRTAEGVNFSNDIISDTEDKAAATCNLNISKTQEHSRNLDNKIFRLNLYSKSVIVDNSPSLRTPIFIGFFFIGLSMLLIVLKRYLIWLFK